MVPVWIKSDYRQGRVKDDFGCIPLSVINVSTLQKQHQIISYFQNIQQMTLNVPLNNNAIPMALAQEHFLLFRQHIEFEVKIDNLGKKNLYGTVFLTSHRIIFVSEKPTPDFVSFDVPIFSMYKESVEFPIFGSTYLMGSTAPYQNLLPGHCHFKLWFKNGGCDTFINNLSKILKEVRKHNNNIQSFIQNSGLYNDLRNGNFQNKAFVDPNDPSKIFVEQPK